jgi:hypothetical protein
MNPEVNHTRFPVKFDNIHHILVLSLSTAKRHAREFKYLFIREGDKLVIIVSLYSLRHNSELTSFA